MLPVSSTLLYSFTRCELEISHLHLVCISNYYNIKQLLRRTPAIFITVANSFNSSCFVSWDFAPFPLSYAMAAPPSRALLKCHFLVTFQFYIPVFGATTFPPFCTVQSEQYPRDQSSENDVINGDGNDAVVPRTLLNSFC